MKQRICIIYFCSVDRERVEFLRLPAMRLAAILGDDAKIFVLFRGTCGENQFGLPDNRCFQYSAAGGKGFVALVWSTLPLSRAILRMIKKHNVRIFMNVWTNYWIFPLLLAKFRYKLHFIARIAGEITSGKMSTKKIIKSALTSMAFRFADRILVISNYLEKNMGRFKEKTMLIPPGLDTKTFRNMSLLREDFILFVGRMVPSKGIQELLEGFALFNAMHPGFCLVLAGPGEFDNFHVPSEIVERIEYLGAKTQEELAEFYNRASCFILPSKKEVYGNVLFEALACACPVIVSNIGNMGSVVGGLGQVLPQVNPMSIAVALKKVLIEKAYDLDEIEKASNSLRLDLSFDRLRTRYQELFNI